MVNNCYTIKITPTIFGKSARIVENLDVIKYNPLFCMYEYISKSTQWILLQFSLMDSPRHRFNV